MTATTAAKKAPFHVDVDASGGVTGGVTVTVSILDDDVVREVEVYAPATITRGYSYAGSGMPLPNFEAAMEGSRNRVKVVAGDRAVMTMTSKFGWPSAFYDERKNLVPPSIFADVTYVDGGVRRFVVQRLPNAFPLRTLEYRPEMRAKGPLFYKERVDATGYMDAFEANVLVPARVKPTGTG